MDTKLKNKQIARFLGELSPLELEDIVSDSRLIEREMILNARLREASRRQEMINKVMAHVRNVA